MLQKCLEKCLVAPKMSQNDHRVPPEHHASPAPKGMAIAIITVLTNYVVILHSHSSHVTVQSILSLPIWWEERFDCTLQLVAMRIVMPLMSTNIYYEGNVQCNRFAQGTIRGVWLLARIAGLRV